MRKFPIILLVVAVSNSLIAYQLNSEIKIIGNVDDRHHQPLSIIEKGILTQKEMNYILNNFVVYTTQPGPNGIGCVAAYRNVQHMWIIWNRCPQPITFSIEFQRGLMTVNQYNLPLEPHQYVNTGLDASWQIIFLDDKHA